MLEARRSVRRKDRIEKEVERAFPDRTRFDIFKKYLAERYNIPTEQLGNYRINKVLNEIKDNVKVGRVSPKKYADLLNAFYIVPGEDPPGDEDEGYSLLEVGEIFAQPWWKGDIDSKAMIEILESSTAQESNYLYVRRSDSNRNAFVIGIPKDPAEHNRPMQYVFRQITNRVVGFEEMFRTIKDLLIKFAERKNASIQRPRTARGGLGGRRPMYSSAPISADACVV